MYIRHIFRHIYISIYVYIASYICHDLHLHYSHILYIHIYPHRRLIEAEGTKDLLRPVLPALVGQYFRIMSDAENDAVLTSLQVYLLLCNMLLVLYIRGYIVFHSLSTEYMIIVSYPSLHVSIDINSCLLPRPQLVHIH